VFHSVILLEVVRMTQWLCGVDVEWGQHDPTTNWDCKSQPLFDVVGVFMLVFGKGGFVADASPVAGAECVDAGAGELAFLRAGAEDFR
jgi:hypothetical protein